MRVALWGAGEVGRGVAYRLVSEAYVSELHWINRTPQKLSGYAIDLRHGLAFAPSCHDVQTYGELEADTALACADLLVLTVGLPVKRGATRESVYEENREALRSTIVPSCASFGGPIIVVTNHVDAIARFVHREANLPSHRVIGLGTLVETARARASLSEYTGTTAARDIAAIGIGTHDEEFVLYSREELDLGCDRDQVLERVRREVAQAASRVKDTALSDDAADRRSTVHPIVESILTIARAVATDSHAYLTVSTLDPADPDGLFYSVPCIVGADGVIERQLATIDQHGRQELRSCVETLRSWLLPLD